ESWRGHSPAPPSPPWRGRAGSGKVQRRIGCTFAISFRNGNQVLPLLADNDRMGGSKCLVFVLGVVLVGGVLGGPAVTAAGPYEPFTYRSYWRKISTNEASRRSPEMMKWLASVLKPDRRFVTIRATRLNG